MTIIGAMGHARGLIQVLEENGFVDDVYLFDDVNSDLPDMIYGRHQVIRSLPQLEAHFAQRGRDFVLGLGGPRRRRDMGERVRGIGGRLTTLIAKSAEVSPHSSRIADGVCILSKAIVGVDVQVGEGTLVNLAAVIAHDAKVGDYCDIGPGAKILGRADVGHLTEIGANAVVLPDVRVGADCRVGAGAVVTRDLPNDVAVVGVPARPLSSA